VSGLRGVQDNLGAYFPKLDSSKLYVLGPGTRLRLYLSFGFLVKLFNIPYFRSFSKFILNYLILTWCRIFNCLIVDLAVPSCSIEFKRNIYF